MTAAEAPLDTPAVIRLAGITYKQLDWWATCKYLKPDRQRPGALPTSGNPRSWTPEELEIARRMGLLTAAKIPPSLAATFARNNWPRGEIAPGIVLEVTRD